MDSIREADWLFGPTIALLGVRTTAVPQAGPVAGERVLRQPDVVRKAVPASASVILGSLRVTTITRVLNSSAVSGTQLLGKPGNGVVDQIAALEDGPRILLSGVTGASPLGPAARLPDVRIFS